MYSLEAYYPQTTEGQAHHAEEEDEVFEHFYPQPPVTLLTAKTLHRTFASPLTINIYYGT